MKKNIVLAIVFLSFFGFIGYRYYILSAFFKQAKGISSYEYSERESIKADDNNFPDYLKNYYASDDIKKDIERPYRIISLKDDYDSEINKKFLSVAEPLFSKEINNFKNLVPIIKNKMKEQKRSVPPTLEESKSFPINPTYKTTKDTTRYWYIMSRLLEQKEDYETALFTSLASLYLYKDLQTNYINSNGLLLKLMGNSAASLCSKSIRIWAREPRPQCKDISKEVAKDILDFVKADYPISNCLEYDCFIMDDMLRVLESKGDRTFARIRKSSYYKKLSDIVYKDPMTFIDKPIYEIKNEMKKNHEKRQKEIIDSDLADLLFYLIFDPDKFMTVLTLGICCPKIEAVKVINEITLAKMEMAAIALAINSYVCEKNKYPESMEELSKWFGRELPNNRLTNEPYTLDFKGEHVLYNEIKSEFLDKKEEFYFNFSFKQNF